MSERPDVLPCQCGGEARHVILSVPQSFVRGRPLEMRADLCQPSFGRAYGRSDAQQFAEHQRVVELNRKAAHENRRSGSSKDRDFQIVGVAPVEAVMSFNNHVGNQEAAQTDPVDFHKRMGTYFGDS